MSANVGSRNDRAGGMSGLSNPGIQPWPRDGFWFPSLRPSIIGCPPPDRRRMCAGRQWGCEKGTVKGSHILNHLKTTRNCFHIVITRNVPRGTDSGYLCDNGNCIALTFHCRIWKERLMRVCDHGLTEAMRIFFPERERERQHMLPLESE